MLTIDLSRAIIDRSMIDHVLGGYEISRARHLTKEVNLLLPDYDSTSIYSSSHGENGSRPQRPLYPRNNEKVHFILHKILYYNTTVSDAMEICFVIIHHVLIDPEFI